MAEVVQKQGAIEMTLDKRTLNIGPLATILLLAGVAILTLHGC
jgi:hypothetical protein